jgi:hypothetical protein
VSTLCPLLWVHGLGNHLPHCSSSAGRGDPLCHCCHLFRWDTLFSVPPPPTHTQNVTNLRRELVSLFTTDALRRLSTETILPLCVQYVSHLVAWLRRRGLVNRKPESPGGQFKHEFWTVQAQVVSFMRLCAVVAADGGGRV